VRLAHKCAVALFAVALGACGGQAPPAPIGSPSPAASGPSGEGLQAFKDGLSALVIPAAGTTDLLSDRLTAAFDLGGSLGAKADVILALLASADRAAYAKLPVVAIPSSRASPSGGVVTAAYFPVVPVPPKAPPPTTEVMFALPGLLDSVGRPGASTKHSGPDSATATVQSDGMTATSTMSTTIDAAIIGSAAALTVTRAIHSTVADEASGSILIDASEAYSVVGRMDVCPTTAGLSIARLEQTINVDATTNAGALGRVGTHSTGSIKTSSDFRGQVDNSATLGGVTQDYAHDEHWTRTAAAEGGPEAKHEGALDVAFTGIGAGVPAEHEFSVDLGDFSGVDGKIKASGDITQQMINSTAIGAAWDYATIDQAFVAAQRLWRNSRCVMVAVPKYNAESQLEVSLQGVEAHIELVDQDSITPFDAALRHRFGQGVTAGLEATLDGKEKLTPSSIAKPPGTLTYTAPGKKGQKARVRMTSTSKQGIGILVIVFDTGSLYEVAATSRWTGNGFAIVATFEAARLTPTDVPGHYTGSATLNWVVEESDPPAQCAKRRVTLTSRVDLVGQLAENGELTVDVTYQTVTGDWYWTVTGTTSDCSVGSHEVLGWKPSPLKLTVRAAGAASTRPQTLVDSYFAQLNLPGAAEVVVTEVAQP
jgi:hypothetical protein